MMADLWFQRQLDVLQNYLLLNELANVITRYLNWGAQKLEQGRTLLGAVGRRGAKGEAPPQSDAAGLQGARGRPYAT